MICKNRYKVLKLNNIMPFFRTSTLAPLEIRVVTEHGESPQGGIGPPAAAGIISPPAAIGPPCC